MWNPADTSARKWVISIRRGGQWGTLCVLPGTRRWITLPASLMNGADRLAVRPISACGNSGTPAVLAR